MSIELKETPKIWLYSSMTLRKAPCASEHLQHTISSDSITLSSTILSLFYYTLYDLIITLSTILLLHFLRLYYYTF